MSKLEQSSRYIVITHLMFIMGIDIVKATAVVAEMEQNGLLRFTEKGNLEIKELETSYETNNC
ncbi:hypothetical protein HMPREF9171_0109 [Streptococcus agalactiae ATCC 13813]|jgi:hypothetical protein|uniref:Uncharacterized protein n=1 Tax=Streptococcus agalactiae TaxID=1311 RepID=A0A7Z7P387_STRAG|nr:hypothetical protein [Streptococcus agalactiae]EFV98384.1 hypothetical protein HMPREF9171_0109 [Streptococcus agalactiae ATCC 13813]MBY4836130.1 hypothetical protein [Streptococcus agalactiae]MBY5054276.1 hypothetical protein [Streptococcus agalactiae]PHU31402.1 hypothetical protein CSW65_06380 [Streptococcus agalactiae]SQA18206.1 Uncharacterised protein [Streptococcus agalactiae]